MNGRAAGVGYPILFGAYLLYSHFSETKLFSEASGATYHTCLAALGLLLLVLGLVFLFKNLK